MGGRKQVREGWRERKKGKKLFSFPSPFPPSSSLPASNEKNPIPLTPWNLPVTSDVKREKTPKIQKRIRLLCRDWGRDTLSWNGGIGRRNRYLKSIYMRRQPYLLQHSCICTLHIVTILCKTIPLPIPNISSQVVRTTIPFC